MGTGGTTITFTVNASANSLSPGTYNATISFTNTTNGNGNTTRTATLTVNDVSASTLQVSPATNISSSGPVRGPFSPSSFQYQLSASTGTLNYSITGLPSWLTASSTSGSVGTGGTTITFTVNASAFLLGPGTYNATISFTNTTNGNGNTTRTATLNVGAPTLQVSPATNMSSSGNQGGPFSPSSFQYQLAASSGTLNYSITGLPSWLTASSTSGSVGTGGTTITFTVNASANSLSPGAYNATVSFTNTTNGNGNTTRTAALTVNAVGTLQVSPGTNMSSSGDQGGPFSPSSFQYQLSASTGTLNYSITGLPSWLTASSASGSVGTGGTTITFTVNASANSLSPNTYNATISFTNTTNGNGNTTRTAALTVNAVGTLQVSPGTNMSSSGDQGGPFSPSSFQYQLSASTGTLNYSITGLPSWLTASSTSGSVGTGGTTITFTVNASANSLSPDTYNATISFTNTTNGNGNTTRTATLTVNAVGTLQVSPGPICPRPATRGGRSRHRRSSIS